MNIKQIYYLDLICKKIDLHSEAFVARINARQRCDWETVEHLENMVLEPLRQQIHYLSVKLNHIAGGNDEW